MQWRLAGLSFEEAREIRRPGELQHVVELGEGHRRIYQQTLGLEHLTQMRRRLA